jgi:hypothetical protein
MRILGSILLAVATTTCLGAPTPARAQDVRTIDLTRVPANRAMRAMDGKPPAVVLPGEIPPEVADALKRAPVTRTIIPIKGVEQFGEQVVKADEIVFSEGAVMTLTNLQAPWIVVAAKRIKFNDPDRWSHIRRDPSAEGGATGTQGATGSKGADEGGETNRTGNPGHPGGPGGPGSAGGAARMPDVYIVAGEFLEPSGPLPAGLLNMVLFFPGMDGGTGGEGGRGGNGGRGGPGKEGATSLFDCKEGGGNGGRGGDGGSGGRGGDGGAGSQGGRLTYVTTKAGAEILSYVRVNNVGGRGGIAGRGGAPGTPGGGGPGARSNGYCRATSSGPAGGYPNPVNLGGGENGRDGDKGTVTAIILPSVDPLF